MLVGDLMDRDLTAVSPETTIAEAVEIMAGQRVTGIPVVGEDGKVVGFLSEKDIVRAALPGYYDLLKDSSFLPDYGQFQKRLREISLERVDKHMQTRVIVLEEQDTDLNAAMVLITKNLKKAPVVKDRVFSGVLSRSDLLGYILHSKREPSD